MNKKIIIIFLFILIIFSINIWLDFKLLNWYNSFYESVINKKLDDFGINIIIYLIISIGIAACLSIFSLLSEYLDLYLKIKFSNSAEKNYNSKNQSKKTNQKLIDDATLAAEKLSVLLPMFVLNIVKALISFIAIWFWAPSEIKIVYLDIKVFYPMPLASIFFALIQIWISNKYYPLVKKADQLKRNAENNFRIKILSQENISNISYPLARYLYIISLLRRFYAKKNFILSLSLSSLSALSYVIPFFVLFSLFYFDEMTFGELMRLSATFGFFQNAIGYLFMNNKELSRGVAAYKRVLSI